MLLWALRPDVGDLGSLWVGRVTWTGSAWGPGSLLGDSTMYEYYYRVTQDCRLSSQGQRDRSEKNCTKAEASQQRSLKVTRTLLRREARWESSMVIRESPLD